jgi:[ribosomal protein S5]-alanine N-acetyltransferase
MRLETPRLVIRDLGPDDLDAVHHILDVDLRMDDRSRDERAQWLQWTVLDYEQRRIAYQPPYGEYAVALRTSAAVVGLAGIVPSLMPFGLLPNFADDHPYAVPEVGLFWAIGSAHQRQGYASEAATAVIAYGFGELRLRRMVATTEHDNAASIGVMRRVGMRVAHNPAPAPFFMQAVGVVANPGAAPDWPTHP